MSELRSALDQLTGMDLDALSADALLDLAGELVVGVNRMASALTTVVRVADRREAYRRDGAVSMKSWLRGSCRVAPDQASAIVSTGRRLEQLPETAAAFASGAISAAHARVITKAVTPGRVAKAADAGIDLAETDEIFAELARATAPHETARGVKAWVAGWIRTAASTMPPTSTGASPWRPVWTAGCICAVNSTPSVASTCAPRSAPS